MVRNLRFRELSDAAQPDGYPDELVLRFGLTGSAGTSAIAAGKADLMTSIGGVPGTGIRLLRDHLRTEPMVGTQFLFLNVAAATFNDRRVRRALNLALDRGRIVRLDGGATAARPTCQILPPQPPGYRPLPPLHTTPHPRRPLARPRPAPRQTPRARSGTSGMKVTVWDTRQPQFAVNEGRVIVAALHRLGYRARLRLLPDSTYFPYVNDSRNRAQIIDGGWGVDYPSTNGFISRLTCRYFVHANAPSTIDASAVCDPAIDRRIARAAELQTTDRTAAITLWLRLDRELTDRAIWLPTTIANETDLPSRRVGNYRYNSLLGVLLDQVRIR
jgi:peptide/nickel transport system substrate-binding protein